MITFEIWTDADPDDKTEVKADSRDVLVWEKTSKTGETYRDVITSFSLAKFYRLAWIAARRIGVVEPKCPLKTFEETYLLEVPTVGGVVRRGGGTDTDDGDTELPDDDDTEDDDAAEVGPATPTEAGASTAA